MHFSIRSVSCFTASGDADPETQPMMINEAQVSHHEQQMTVDNYWGDVESDAAIDVNGHQVLTLFSSLHI